MVRVVRVELDVLAQARPLEHTGPLDAVLGKTGGVGDRADREGGGGRVDVERALVARRDRREDDTRLALEALSAAVDERLEAVRVLHVDHLNELGVDPAARRDRVQTSDDDVELHVELVGVILDLAVVGRHLDAGDTLVDERSGHLGLGLADISLAEEELAVEVGNVDRVHVDDVNVAKTSEGEILQDLASQSASSDDKHLALVTQELLGLEVSVAQAVGQPTASAPS